MALRTIRAWWTRVTSLCIGTCDARRTGRCNGACTARNRVAERSNQLTWRRILAVWSHRARFAVETVFSVSARWPRRSNRSLMASAACEVRSLHTQSQEILHWSAACLALRGSDSSSPSSTSAAPASIGDFSSSSGTNWPNFHAPVELLMHILGALIAPFCTCHRCGASSLARMLWSLRPLRT